MRVLARIYALWGGVLVGAALMLLAGVASATTLVFDNAGNIVGSSAGTWGGRAATWGSASVQPGGIGVSANLPTTVSGGKASVSVPVVASRLVTPQALGRIAVKGAKGLVPGLVLAQAIRDEIQSAGYECDLSGCRTLGVEPSTVAPTVETQAASQEVTTAAQGARSWSGVCYKSGSSICPIIHPDKPYFSYYAPLNSHFCQQFPHGGDFAQFYPGSCTFTEYTCPSSGGWSRSGSSCSRSVCPSGYSLSGASCVRSGVVSQPVSDDVVASDVGDHLVSEDGARLVDQAIASGVPVEATSPVLSGPPSVSSAPFTTTKNVGGQTTTYTTTTTVNNSYVNNTYTYSITNTTVASGAENGTTTEEVASQEDVSVSDSPMPALPVLYERKYPDGLGGVWNTRSAELRATPLFGLSAIFQPTVSAGSCPSWSMAFNFGQGMNYGSAATAAPCWIWPFVKVIVIITALLLARRLIFGG